MNWTTLSLSDFDFLSRHLDTDGAFGSDCSLVNLFLLQKKYDIQTALAGGFLFRYYTGGKNRTGYGFPLALRSTADAGSGTCGTKMTDSAHIGGNAAAVTTSAASADSSALAANGAAVADGGTEAALCERAQNAANADSGVVDDGACTSGNAAAATTSAAAADSGALAANGAAVADGVAEAALYERTQNAANANSSALAAGNATGAAAPSLREALALIVADAAEHGRAVRFCLCDAAQKDALAACLSTHFPQVRLSWHTDRDDSDYVYERAKLAALSGKTYHKKKNHVSRFLRAYEGAWEFRLLSLCHIDSDMISVAQQWLEEHFAAQDDGGGESAAEVGAASAVCAKPASAADTERANNDSNAPSAATPAILVQPAASEASAASTTPVPAPSPAPRSASTTPVPAPSPASRSASTTPVPAPSPAIRSADTTERARVAAESVAPAPAPSPSASAALADARAHERRVLELELESIRTAVQNKAEFALEGGVLYVHGAPVAMTLASRINGRVLDVHFEKCLANAAANGAYAAINWCFANACERFRYLNREEDMGVEGLRKAKLSYHPDLLVEKYYALEEESC